MRVTSFVSGRARSRWSKASVWVSVRKVWVIWPVRLCDTKAELVKEQSRKYQTTTEAGVDVVFATRQLLEVIPNPWIAHDISKEIIATLTHKNGLEMVANNFVFIVQELVKRATAER